MIWITVSEGEWNVKLLTILGCMNDYWLLSSLDPIPQTPLYFIEVLQSGVKNMRNRVGPRKSKKNKKIGKKISKEDK